MLLTGAVGLPSQASLVYNLQADSNPSSDHTSQKRMRLAGDYRLLAVGGARKDTQRRQKLDCARGLRRERKETKRDM